MIIKASQRGSGANLAAHLMKLDDNEHLRVHEIRGFASDNLHDAFREAEAISRGTKCRQYLFSVSINPPIEESVSVDVFEDAIERIESRMGLEGQPRAIVFHEKENRLHAHCVWSRIDADTMTAKQLSFFKTKLFNLARDLHLEHGWIMPRGMAEKGLRDPTNFSLAEWQQFKRQGIEPRLLKTVVQDCWSASDDRRSFEHSLQERGFFLAKGDKRGHVLVDHTGEVYSLPRMLGAKSKDVRNRFGDGADLRTVADVRKVVAERMTPTIRRHIEKSRELFRLRSARLGAQKADITKWHRKERATLDESQKQEWDKENLVRAKRLPKGLRGLWHRLTGEYGIIRKLNEAEAQDTQQRQERDRKSLIDKQRVERSMLQARFKELRGRQAEKLLKLREDVGRYLKLGRSQEAPQRMRQPSLGLALRR